ncbi:MAG: ATP-grasp domain-containing protein [Planctomycetes bacterium]|nr:ATP-grasp domain-containing protein [Planctomycetota bacterium]
MESVTWIVDPAMFPPSYKAFCDTISRLGHKCLTWNLDWWHTGKWPKLEKQAVVFHGSLGNADRVRRELRWKPGAYCASESFFCSVWYSQAKPWLVHERWVQTTVEALVNRTKEVLEPLGVMHEVFVRPDSPLKPFSGRVLPLDRISLKALDHGYYYEDTSLPVIVAPVRKVTQEWRFVVVESKIVAGCSYDAASRKSRLGPTQLPTDFASEVARNLTAPEEVYVLDIGEVDESFRLIELNPFSGADLYSCDPEPIVREVSKAALKSYAQIG